MANEIDALLARVDDPALRHDLKTQFDRLRQKRQFGLVFEEHLPERVTLPQHPIRRGTKVVPRDDDSADSRVVAAVNSGMATLPTDDGSTEDVPTDSLVAIAEFGEPIYPGLKRLGSVDLGGDKPAHVVIKGENHHALEALQFTHAGKVDCIYIDPPFNTGARDWKYNNNYVDERDSWRHSKWLSMMTRRLVLAGELLTRDGVLIVAIDEHEVHGLGLLLRQLFPSARVQMITAVINSKGVHQGGFARIEEHAFFCFLGGAGPAAIEDDYYTESGSKRTEVWATLLRRGNGAKPSDRPNQSYPIAVDADSGRLIGVGRSAKDRAEADELDLAQVDTWEPPVEHLEGVRMCWPRRSDGALGRWMVMGETLVQLARDGYVRFGAYDAARDTWAGYYVSTGNRKKIEAGEIRVLGTHPDAGHLILDGGNPRSIAKTVWARPRHDAGSSGTRLLSALLGERLFDYPKSLYLVEDALRAVLAERPDATVLDFFAGSGTTSHAVARLNRQDGGRRRSISVTNNEVAAAKASALLASGHRSGDPDWESQGIYEQVTRPRIEAAITGRTPDGEPVKGDYRFTDEFPMAEGFEESVEFVELTYLDAEDIELDMAFAGIAPLLWMRAGSQGPVIEERVDHAGDPLPYASTGVYAVLFDPDQWRPFLEELPDTVTTVFAVTDSASVFAGVASELPDGLDVVRLYENYLTTFAINQGGRR